MVLVISSGSIDASALLLMRGSTLSVWAGLLVELERWNGGGSGEERPAGEGDHTVGGRGEGPV